MKISDQPPIQPAPLPPASRPAERASSAINGSPRDDAGATGRAGAPAANVAISARSRELHQALGAANAAPDVRADVVAQVRARLLAGTYRIDPDRIARGILDASA
jgi:flagellar biosynthesis anti-sigma factor FlgM